MTVDDNVQSARERLVQAVEDCRLGKTGAYAALEQAYDDFELAYLIRGY